MSRRYCNWSAERMQHHPPPGGGWHQGPSPPLPPACPLTKLQSAPSFPRRRPMQPLAKTREGILSSTAFPGLIYSIMRQRETGVLTLTGDAAEKSVYIKDGRPVFATSNDRDDRLGQILFKAGLVSLEGLMEALE